MSKYNFTTPITVSINEQPTSKYVASSSGRNSKCSSKVYHYTVDDLKTNGNRGELDEWFGPIDAVRRSMQCRK